MNRLTHVLHSFAAWLRDPFGRKELVMKHENILCQMSQATEDTRVVLDRELRAFAIGGMVGNQQIRQRKKLREKVRNHVQ